MGKDQKQPMNEGNVSTTAPLPTEDQKQPMNEGAAGKTNDKVTPSPILDTAPSNGKPEADICPATGEYHIPKYKVKRMKGAIPVSACDKCLGPAMTYYSMEAIKA